MTYDPDRDAKAPADVSPNVRPEESKPASGVGMLMFLLILLVIAGAGVIYFYVTGTSSNSDITDLQPPITQPSSPATTGQSRDQ